MRIGKIAAIGATAAVMTVGGTGLAAASASTVQRPAASGTEHISLMTTQPSGAKYAVIASGLFTAGGVDVSGGRSDLIKLPAGTFKISHGVGHVLRQHLNPRTCLMSFAATAKFSVGSGTGAYKGISGSGQALISAVGITRRAKGKCDTNANPVVLEQTITGSAHLTL